MSVAEMEELTRKVDVARIAEDKARALAAEEATKAGILEEQQTKEAVAREEADAKAQALSDSEMEAEATKEDLGCWDSDPG